MRCISISCIILILLFSACINLDLEKLVIPEDSENIVWSKDIPVSEVNIFSSDSVRFSGVKEHPLHGITLVKDENGQVISLGQSNIDTDQENNIYFIKTGNEKDTRKIIFLEKYDEKGTELINDLEVSRCPVSAYDPSISIRGNYIYLMYRCERGDYQIGTNRSLFFSKLGLNGNIIQEATEILGEDVNPRDYHASYDQNDNINLVYNSYQTYFVRKDVGGYELFEPIKMSLNLISLPSVATDSKGNVHIVWKDSSEMPGRMLPPGTILYGQVRNGEMGLTQERILATGAYGSPLLEIDSKDNLHIMWTTKEGGIEYLKLNANGVGIENKTVVPEKADYSTLDIDTNDKVHITWLEDRYEVDPQPKNSYLESIRPFAKRYYRTTMNISHIEKGFRPTNSSIYFFEMEVLMDTLDYIFLSSEDKADEELLELTKKSPFWVEIGVWGTGSKVPIYMAINGSDYNFITDYNMLYKDDYEVRKAGSSNYFKFAYKSQRDKILYQSTSEFEGWDARIDVTDKGDKFLLNVTFRQPVQDKMSIIGKLDEFNYKNIEYFTDYVEFRTGVGRDFQEGELMTANYTGNDNIIEVIEERWSWGKGDKLIYKNYTNIDIDNLNSKIITQLYDSSFSEKDYNSQSNKPAYSAEYDSMSEHAKITYKDGSEIELECHYNSYENSEEMAMCSLRMDNNHYYLVNLGALFVLGNIEGDKN